jgi:hypothetical protein
MISIFLHGCSISKSSETKIHGDISGVRVIKFKNPMWGEQYLQFIDVNSESKIDNPDNNSLVLFDRKYYPYESYHSEIFAIKYTRGKRSPYFIETIKNRLSDKFSEFKTPNIRFKIQAKISSANIKGPVPIHMRFSNVLEFKLSKENKNIPIAYKLGIMDSLFKVTEVDELSDSIFLSGSIICDVVHDSILNNCFIFPTATIDDKGNFYSYFVLVQPIEGNIYWPSDIFLDMAQFETINFVNKGENKLSEENQKYLDETTRYFFSED